MKSVAVTGLGVVSNVGASLDAFWSALTEAKGKFRQPILRKNIDIRVGAVDDAQFADGSPQANLDRYDRGAQLAIAAAVRAAADAGLSLPLRNGERVAVVFSGAAGGQETLDAQYARLFLEERRLHPLTVSKVMLSAPVSAVTIALGAKGPSFLTSSACASGAHAIGIAASLIRSGLVDIAFAGGAEACLNYGTLAAWDSMRIMSKSVCQPFSRTRDGLTLSEGAAALALESPDHARARGARTDTEFVGFGASADAADMFQPSVEGMLRAMRASLRDADLSPSLIDYVNAHGTGTRSNDIAETAALRELFAPGACPPTSSTKGVTGHALGAAAAIEAVATVLALRAQVAPPTANFQSPDPECDIDCIPNVARPLKMDYALSNSFAFGGLNATLAFRQRRA